MSLDIYSYCNYKDSSVGFQIGKVDLKSGKIFRTDAIPQYIIQSFESGLVNKAYGRYPGKKNIKYFYLLKHINYIDNYPEPDKYINIAFECSDIMTYVRIKHFLQSKTPEQISQLFGEMIFVDNCNPEFEMKFEINQLSSFMNQLDNETSIATKGKNYDYFLIVSLYGSKMLELIDLFQLKKLRYALCNGEPDQKGQQYLYRFVKKKIWMKILVIVVVVIFLLGLYLVLRK